MSKPKIKLSISIDENTLERVREGIRLGKFRNKSHAFEYAINAISKDNLNFSENQGRAYKC